MTQSWIVTAPRTGRVVGEIYDKRNADTFKRAGYIVKTALQHLQDFNASVRA